MVVCFKAILYLEVPPMQSQFHSWFLTSKYVQNISVPWIKTCSTYLWKAHPQSLSVGLVKRWCTNCRTFAEGLAALHLPYTPQDVSGGCLAFGSRSDDMWPLVSIRLFGISMNFARVTCPKQNWDMESNAGGSAKPQASNFLTQQQEVEAAVNEDERYLRSLCSAVKGSEWSEWHGKRLLSGQMVVQPICIYENLMSSKSWNVFVELSGVPIYHSIVSSTWGSWCFQLCLLLLSHELRGTLCNSTTGTARRSHPFFRCKLHRWYPAGMCRLRPSLNCLVFPWKTQTSLACICCTALWQVDLGKVISLFARRAN